VIESGHATGERSSYIIGLDLGQKRDYTAIAMLQVHERVYPQRDPVTWDFLRTQSLRLVYLERVPLGTSYPDVVEHVTRLLRDPRLHGCTLVADATGVGAPVVDLLRKAQLNCRLLPVTITNGAHDAPVGSGYHVPRRDLITGLQVLFDEGELQIASAMPMAEALVKELTRLKRGSRDDLVLATALAWWWARKTEAWRAGQRRVV
jgi:hypothetical protein